MKCVRLLYKSLSKELAPKPLSLGFVTPIKAEPSNLILASINKTIQLT